MSRFPVKMFFGMVLGVALLSLLAGTLAGLTAETPDNKDNPCKDGNCHLTKAELNAIINKAYRLGYEKGYEAGAGQSALYLWDSSGESDYESLHQLPSVQFHDRGTGPPLVVPPRGGIPGSR